MTVRIYHNHDSDAPVLSNTPGSMIEVLEAVLVNGYGEKAPLGWTKEFHQENIAVFRNDPTVPGSTGMYLWIDDSHTTYARVRCYKTMSDINTGTDVIPDGNVSGYTSYMFWTKHSSVGPTNKRWTIMGDELTFYFNVNTYGSYPTDTITAHYACQLYACGDFTSYAPGNEWNYFIAGRPSDSGTAPCFPSGTHQHSSNNNTIYIGRSQELMSDKSAVAWCTTINGWFPGQSNSYATSPYTGLIFMQPAYLSEARDSTYITGELRGCYYQIGRKTLNWFDDYGKHPDDPTGPDIRQLLCSSTGQLTTASASSLLVKESDW